ncbi:hypothetical protein BpHYR1_047624 [Brachionus plicatilis]|uniref:Uncharacterized protein n=1 Tax=Brachionus plicatilis TaxID=10195 RepID=A0A3M7PFV4_BRAPC|nr:hypothetical protein BpHYR1_047624 [Brachionus plicatilis]
MFAGFCRFYLLMFNPKINKKFKYLKNNLVYFFVFELQNVSSDEITLKNTDLTRGFYFFKDKS